MVRYTGSCHCKTVAYEIVIPDGQFQEPPEYDSCVDCRRVAGTLLTGWLFILASQLKWLTGEDKLTLYKSSENVERQFCSVCGCQFTYKSLERNRKLETEGKEATIDVSIGTLDEEILMGSLEIVPWRYAYWGDAPEWMKRIMPSEKDIQSLTANAGS